jgi:putative DNA primase/helicase
MMCDVPCGINERQAADRNVDQLVYMMGEGKGRTRGAKSGGLRHTAQWRTIALTNGEEPISRTSSAQGVRTRTIEVEAVPFDDESVAHNLYDAIDANHGHAGPAFVGELVKLMPEEIRRHHDLIHDRIAVAGSVPTYHAALAIIALADYYAMQWIFGAAEGEAFAGAVRLGRSFLEQMPTKVEGGEALREYDEIMHLVIANRTRFSLRQPGGALANGEEWGVLKDEVAYFNPQVLQRELERLGFRFIPAKRRLAKSGRLFTEPNGEGGERLSRRLWSSRYVPISISNEVLAALPDTTDENDRLAGVLA